MFAALEKEALKPLPRSRFVVATWSTGKVGPDIHVKVGAVLYSVPWRLIGQRVEARSTATSVQIVHDATVVATHPRAERGRCTNPDHYPPEKIAFNLKTPVWCRTTAAQIGPSCAQVIDELMIDNALFRLRAAQGILGLRDKHSPQRLENACAAALSAGDPSYRTIKGILATGTESAAGQAAAAAARAARAAAAPAFLRGQADLFALPEHDQPQRHSPTRDELSQSEGVVVHLPTTSDPQAASTSNAALSAGQVAR